MKLKTLLLLLLLPVSLLPQTTQMNGNYNVQGQMTIGNINNVLYVDGVNNATLAGAFAKCGTSCIIAMASPTILNLGSFDPSTTAVTLLLGPYTYQVTQITLRTNLRVLGANSTVLQQASSSTPPIALPTSGGAATSVAQHVELAYFNMAPSTSPASTTDAISLVAAGCGVGCAGGGLWYSAIHDITIQQGFGRNSIRVDGTLCDQCSAVQFTSFRNIWAIRALNAAPDLYITGSYIGQMMFDSCEFDGQGEFGGSDTTANLSNIHIDNTAGIRPSPYIPYSIKFQNTIIQGANGTGGMGIQVVGASNVTLDNAHFEHDTTIASYTNGAWAGGIWNSYIDSFSGSGGLIQIDNGSSLFFYNNTMATNPPSGGFLVSGSVGKFLYWLGNMNNVGGGTFSPLPNPGTTITNLPSAVDSVGENRVVTDSTAIASEGQACVHTASSPVTAIAISNGSIWKCF